MRRLLLPLALCALLQACAVPRMLPAASDLRAGDAEVVVIGKIELVPPLEGRLEQKTHWNVVGESRMLRSVFMATGGEFRPVRTPDIDASDFQAGLEAEWGVPFMVRMPRQRTYLNGAFAHLDLIEQDKLWFPGGYYFEVPRDAQAVYIGTLRYHRNDFNSITRAEIVDERKDIASVLKAPAAPAQVRSSLLKRVRP